jgi:hypothetical protein
MISWILMHRSSAEALATASEHVRIIGAAKYRLGSSVQLLYGGFRMGSARTADTVDASNA